MQNDHVYILTMTESAMVSGEFSFFCTKEGSPFVGIFLTKQKFIPSHDLGTILRSSLEKPHTLTLALSHQGRGDLKVAPPLTGGPSIRKTEGDKGEGL